ncbi:hypothetical protein P9K31_14600 [Corynebacterium glutamicum]|uniref:hypothetical protein n=1 Tax=Corynebacterium TaxID=1716 RepID=UPI00058A5D38|nr:MULTISPECIES: hypothetical protein [Corynebacterium]AJE68553.1 hypothetical protein SB89_14060 [Corynebacterium glutamicum]ALP51350.1 hypothetical protein AC079_14825 [Corynebacterium glutamicum]ANR63850.1 hypothetical protein C628_14850 [[Brevibacterium] flavum ZL-1]ANR66858.1 hypothetical protein C627_14715 [Corynebacterium glutamicum ZL-6]ANU34872.1 hypothetical protein BBD29_14600 [Corynebacterium glutamicum]
MFKIRIIFPDGTDEEQDEHFDTEREAEEHGAYLASCYRQGNEILHMSNPGDYPLEDEDADYEVIEVDE